MARPAIRSLSKIPQVSETRLLGIAHLHIWITPPDETPHRPWLIVVISGQSGTIRASNLVPNEPTPAQVCDVLILAIREPASEVDKPARPQALALAPPFDVQRLLSLLQAMGLELDVYERELPPEFNEMIADLEDRMRGGPKHPGYLFVKDVTPDLVGSLFQAAAEFYRAAPWVQLNNSQIVALRHPAESEYRYAIVMGNGGVEYGVAMYLNWADVKRQFLGDEDPMRQIPKDGLHSLFFDAINRIPFADVEAIEKFGWEIAAPNAYPIAIVVETNGAAHPPARQDLEWYEAALRAIPIVVREYLKPNGKEQIHLPSASGDYAPIETTIQVATRAGTLSVAVKYPAGEIPPAELSAQEPERGAEEADAQELPRFDRRAMEGAMFKLTDKLDVETQSSDAGLDAAQALMYRAWAETNPAKRIALAHHALVRSRSCADAYVLLAEEEADTVERALASYQEGVAAGERGLAMISLQSTRDIFGACWRRALHARP